MAILVDRGRWQEAAMRREGATGEEMIKGPRNQGIGFGFMDVATGVAIDTEGLLSVGPDSPSGDGTSSLAKIADAVAG